MSHGKLYGVGVGPGASDLMTMRSINVLRKVDVIAIPQSSPHVKSVAWRIAEKAVGPVEGQERIFLHFPMTRDPEQTVPAWNIAFAEIETRLKAGKSVAFITEGDPLFFSTYIYLHTHAKEKWPEVEIEVVPAVSSFTAVPSIIQTPIADGQERVAVIPASYGLEDLPAIFRLFDTVLLMKVSSVMPEVVKILEDENLLECSYYVSRATMEFEKVVRDLRSIQNDKCDYFSMIVVSKRGRSGILAGRVASETLGA